MRLRNLVGAVSLTMAVAGCNNSLYGSGGGCTPTATQVCMVNSTFSPFNRTVTAGTTVEWRNGDGITHTVTSDTTAEVYNQSVGGGGTFTHQFNTVGTYPYHCTIHGAKGSGMHGTITVN